MLRRGFLFGCLALSACATLPPPALAPEPVAPLPELEPLFGVKAGDDGLTIRAASHGCTDRAGFVAYVERRNGVARIAFARRRIDQCRPTPWEPVAIFFSWRELGIRRGERVAILNPQMPAHPGESRDPS
jgi:hypothetical protein